MTGRYEEALAGPSGRADPRGGNELLLALAGAGRGREALALADSLLAANDTVFAWDSLVVAALGQRGSRRAPRRWSIGCESDPRRLAGPPGPAAVRGRGAARRRRHRCVRGAGFGMRPRWGPDRRRRHARGFELLRRIARVGRARSTISRRRPIRSPALIAGGERCAAEAAQLAGRDDREAARLGDSAGTAPGRSAAVPRAPRRRTRSLAASPLAADALPPYRRLEWPDSPYAPKALLAAQLLDPDWRRLRPGAAGRALPRQSLPRHAPRRGRDGLSGARGFAARLCARQPPPQARPGVAALPPATPPAGLGRPSVAATRSRTTTGRPAGASRAVRAAATELSRTVFGRQFQNPLLLAAGTAGFGRELDGVMDLDRLGGIVTKAVSLEPRAGNRAAAGGRVPGRHAQLGRARQSGARPGADATICPGSPRTCSRARRCWSTSSGSRSRSTREVVAGLDGVPASPRSSSTCPVPTPARAASSSAPTRSASGASCRSAARGPALPLVAKLSPVLPDIAGMALWPGTRAPMPSRVVNTMPGLLLRRAAAPRLGNGNGGVSGPALLPVGVLAVARVVERTGACR